MYTSWFEIVIYMVKNMLCFWVHTESTIHESFHKCEHDINLCVADLYVLICIRIQPKLYFCNFSKFWSKISPVR